MFAGHFGLAAIVKARHPEIPLWALMVSTQWLDIAFIPLFISGVETIEILDGGGYGEQIIHAEWTHSLVGTTLLSFLAGWIASRIWSVKAGIIIGLLSGSHWLLDLIVHNQDMPLLPGHADGLALWGLSLWSYPVYSIVLEALIVATGILMYSRWRLTQGSVKRRRVQAIITSVFVSSLLIFSMISDFL
ncbi:permease [Paenibacillus swuensis]|uniref:Permease n=1 Tax=Paenibacillus swuensis TaxID=1178515 RepID=A0A172TGV2_9BACL|nr:permease [Paenibacillus swuensis]ANE46124.1 permease [Paenibacillus swuensis]